MKILIMGFAKLKYMPYLRFYLESLNGSNQDIHLLYWNRDLQQEDLEVYSDYTLHEFCLFQPDDAPKLSKLRSFRAYRSFAKQLILGEKFDFIIVLHSLPGVLLSKTLVKHYRNRFIFDYRDYTYEGFLPYKKIIGRLVIASRYTFVSSDAFRKFLPENQCDKIKTSHNLSVESLSHRDEKRVYGIPSDKIRIGFWGIIRHEELNKAIIDRISRDERFELHYHGREQQIALNLKQYAKSIAAKNIFFHGEYSPEERYLFARQTELIHNLYCDENMMLAMANKYYDGIVFRIPQLCMKGSYMGTAAQKAGVGFICDPAFDDFTDQLYSYYSSLSKSEFERNCDREVERVLHEYNVGIEAVSELFKGDSAREHETK